MSRFTKMLEQFNKTSKMILGVLLLVLVTFLDFYTGTQLSFTFFYLIPIAFFSFAFSASIGIRIAYLSAACWLFVEVLTAPATDTFVYVWNTIIRLGFFLLSPILFKLLEQERIHARTDFLTGAINNRHFNEMLEREIERSLRYKRPFTVAFIDLDNFKIINDTFGHTFGDSLLKKIAESMKTYLRKTDVIARMGGDEFAILLPETSATDAQIAISNLYQKINHEIWMQKSPVTLSVGVLSLKAPNISVDKILGIVDKMMYVVKNNGKNNIKYAIYSNEETITLPRS